jgi:hypothetical protein
MLPPKMKRYAIRVEGHLDPAWESCFDGMRLTHLSDPSGRPLTQLYGLLAQLRNLGLALVSVQPEEAG